MPGCALRYCRNTSKNTDKSSGVTFHRFPRGSDHRKEWTQFVREDRSEPHWIPTEHTYLCSVHFRENDFIYTLTGRKFTKLSAVPSIPSEFYQNVPDSAPSGPVCMETDDETVGYDKWDGRNVAMEENVRPDVGGPRVAGCGLVLESATVPRLLATECSVFGCRNNVRDNPEKTFFPFPTQPERFGLWLNLINRKDLATKLRPISDHRVCSDHFGGNDYNGLRLHDAAVPQYKLPVRRVNIIYEKDEQAGPSRWQDSQIKTVVDTVQVEIQFEPKEQVPMDTNIKQEPSSPKIVEPSLVPSNPFTPALAPNPQNTLRRKQMFLQRATLSPIEYIYLPGILTDGVINSPNQTTVHVQTTKALLDPLIAPHKKQHEANLRAIKRDMRALDMRMQRYVRAPYKKIEFLQSCDAYLDDTLSNLVKYHMTITTKPSGKRYSSEFKMVALTLYFSNPRSFKFVSKLIHLPSRETIVRAQMSIRTGINAQCIEYFKAKVEKMSAKEKTCCVYFDHMDLSKNLHYCITNDLLYGLHDIDQVSGTDPANYATLIMVKGLYDEWQQPISFAYVAEKLFYTELKEWLYKIIALLFDIGLNVKALVMGLGTEFLEFPEVSIAEPYFEVLGRRVYQIFDVPTLFESARDALLEYDFHIGSKCVKWSHIMKVYSHDKKQKVRLVPKLTDAHVRPRKENESKLAIEVFSRSVAAAMNYHVIAKLINANASDTVEFIKIMNNLFDILNARKMSDDGFKQSYVDTVEQKKFLTSAFEYLKQLEIKDKHGNPVDESASCVTGLLVTIKSVASLFEDLEQENFGNLSNRFNLECMKKYFKKVRDLGGNCCTKPTPVMFARSFRRLFVVSLASDTKGDPGMDLKTILTKISDHVNINDEVKEEAEPSHNRFLVSVGGDCLKLWPKPGPKFTGGFLLSKCLGKHCCHKFLDSLCKQYNVELSDAESLIKQLKEYKPKNLNKTDLLEPPEFIVDAAVKMDKIFEDYIQRDDKDTYKFGRNIYLAMESEVFELPCDCFPLMYLKQVYIRTKIFHMVRHYNRNVKPPKRFRMVLKKPKVK